MRSDEGRCQGDWMDSRAVSSRGPRRGCCAIARTRLSHCLLLSPPSTLCANSDLRGSPPDIRICYNGNIASFQILHANPDSKRRFFLRVYIYICRRRQQFTGGGGGETGCEKVITEGKTYRINFDRSSLNFLSPACCKPVNPNGTSFAHHRVSRWSRLVNPQREGKREEKNGELYHRNHSSSCARSVVWSVECVVGIASERERKREQLAGPPRAPASFLASRRVCKLPRGRRTMVIPMEDWPCTLCRPQVRDANLLVAG